MRLDRRERQPKGQINGQPLDRISFLAVVFAAAPELRRGRKLLRRRSAQSMAALQRRR